tara:strand:- start:1646 stop:2008 length:363 start_codon:yes stop_codon:yes gene_type:complete
MRIIIIALSTILFACNEGFNSAPDPPDTPETVIIRIDVIPNPVQVGDTVTFIGIIEDSLKKSFNYVWSTPLNPSSVKTANNIYKVLVDMGQGDYSGTLIVDDTTKTNLSPTKNFNFRVIQ